MYIWVPCHTLASHPSCSPAPCPVLPGTGPSHHHHHLVSNVTCQSQLLHAAVGSCLGSAPPTELIFSTLHSIHRSLRLLVQTPPWLVICAICHFLLPEVKSRKQDVSRALLINQCCLLAFLWLISLYDLFGSLDFWFSLCLDFRFVWILALSGFSLWLICHLVSNSRPVFG